ncbi:MAG: addiction module antidote protein [Melioribacteraceae bacterium]|nr:addiction module antidote protein [Melioribacteraceae bacterium]
MSEKIAKFDIADYLDDDLMIAEYLTSVLETGDTAMLISAVGDIAKAKGMKEIAEIPELGRESLYKALKSNSHPRFDTIVKVLDSLNIKLKFESKSLSEQI